MSEDVYPSDPQFQILGGGGEGVFNVCPDEPLCEESAQSRWMENNEWNGMRGFRTSGDKEELAP